MILPRVLNQTHSASLITRPSWSRPGALRSFYSNILHGLRPPRPDLTAYCTMASRRSARLTAQARVLSMPPPPPAPTKPRKRKASCPDPAAMNGIELSTAAPSTPKRRGRRTTTTTPPPATPTPSAIGLIAEPAAVKTPAASQTSASASAVTTPKPKSRAVARLADPKGTNATLLSPETSRIVTRKPTEETSTPSTQAKITTENILAEARAHLIRTEPRLKPMLVKPVTLVFPWGGRSVGERQPGRHDCVHMEAHFREDSPPI